MKIEIETSVAINWFGSKTKIAKALGISKQSLTDWGKLVPQKSALVMYILTEGKLGARVDE